MMIDELTVNCPTDCGVDRTRAIAKATCAAFLASGAATIH